MNLLRKSITLLGSITLLALLLSALAPKAARGVAAALVQIVPGTTTHVGQNEVQLVNLVCQNGFPFCVAIDPTGAGGESNTPYVVPSGSTLIVTDYESAIDTGTAPNILVDSIVNSADPGSKIILFSATTTNRNGFGFLHEHYGAGVRIGSGVTIADTLASPSGCCATASVQGYLVPN